MRHVPIVLVLLASCGPAVPFIEEDGTTGGAQESSTSASVGTDAPPDPSSAAEVETADDDAAAADGGEVGSGFIDATDSGGKRECDLWVDDCPLGEKCMPWANDGGNSWNSTRCSPIAEQPNAVGEPCTVEVNGVSGIDDCVRHSMCWDVDVETQQGTCVAFCTGDEANPTCADPCETCSINGSGVLILCLPACDPLLQDCYAGAACYPGNNEFFCSPDASSDAGALGDPCEFLNVCDPGLFCANPERVPGCTSSYGCCAAFCDALADNPCVGMSGGVACIPWYEEGEAPPCASGVIGACILPE